MIKIYPRYGMETRPLEEKMELTARLTERNKAQFIALPQAF